MFAISPDIELGAYEYLLNEEVSSYKQLSDLMKEKKALTPSLLVSQSNAEKYMDDAISRINKSHINNFDVIVAGTSDYIEKLNDLENPIPVLYFQGNLDYLQTKSVAIVGSRNPSLDGKKRAYKLVKELVQNDFTIVSGLAAGIDTVAHEAAIEMGGRTIAVIGTPITHYYPKSNQQLQTQIARNHLLVSQVPIIRYDNGNPKTNRFNFPERNKTMSAISDATVIVEASNTSGTLTQARAAIKQKRKLFILNNNFENPELNWPSKFEEKGAIRAYNTSQILEKLTDASK